MRCDTEFYAHAKTLMNLFMITRPYDFMKMGVMALIVASGAILMLAAHVHVQQQQQYELVLIPHPHHHLQHSHHPRLAQAEMETKYNPPTAQYKSGISPEDIMCKKEHVLAIRTDQSPVCITPDTAERMMKRGGIIESVIGHTATTAHQRDANAADSAAMAEKIGAVTDSPSTANASSIDSSTVVHTSNSSTGTTTNDTSGAVEGIGKGDTNYNNANDSMADANPKNNSQTINNNVAKDPKAANVTHSDGKNEDVSSQPAPAATGQHQYNTHQGRVNAVPASTMSIVNFYLTDDDLNRAPNAAETIPINGLFKFTINGMPISGPDTMIETGPNTGQFYIRLVLPETIDGRPLNQNDVVDVTYTDQTDSSGERRTVTKSFELSSTYAQINSEGDGKRRIGHEFTLRIYDPDANADSREENKIPLSRFVFESKGNVKATLDHRAFDANKSHMIETGPNTGVFEVTIKIPRQIDGDVIHIGDWYKITYNDYTTPSGTAEEIVLRGKIGL